MLIRSLFSAVITKLDDSFVIWLLYIIHDYKEKVTTCVQFISNTLLNYKLTLRQLHTNFSATLTVCIRLHNTQSETVTTSATHSTVWGSLMASCDNPGQGPGWQTDAPLLTYSPQRSDANPCSAINKGAVGQNHNSPFRQQYAASAQHTVWSVTQSSLIRAHCPTRHNPFHIEWLPFLYITSLMVRVSL